MKEHLQPWYDRWLKDHEDTDLIYARGGGGKVWLRQVHFVRDSLAPLFWCDVPYDERNQAPPRDDCVETAHVVGEHTSKSVRLPVYSLERQDLGLRVVLRENFYDWNVSVVSGQPVAEADLRGFVLDYRDDEERRRFAGGFVPGRSWGYCYFQGFPEDLQFGPYRENSRRFSLYLRSDYEVYALCWMLIRDLRSP